MLSAPVEANVPAEQRMLDLENTLVDQQTRLDDIATMGLVITSLLDLDEVLSASMEMATRVVGGEVGCILLAEQNELSKRISWGLDDAALEQIRYDADTTLVQHVFTSGQSVIINELPSEQSARGAIKQVIAVPVQPRDQRIGVVVIVNKIDGSVFSDADRSLLETVVRFAAVAIDNAKLLRQQLRQQQLEQELALAHEVQQALLPPRTAEFRGARVDTIYLPAGQVGGDYFDIIDLSEEEFVVVVGDVSSHGVPAALQMAAVRSVFRMKAAIDLKGDRLMREANNFLCEQVFKPENSFITLVLAHFDLQQKVCNYVNAGHLPPLHHCDNSGEIKEWRTGGTFLGQFPEFVYRRESVPLAPGDKVLFYTDGISETTSPTGEMFGRQRVTKFLAEHSTTNGKDLLCALQRKIDRFASVQRTAVEQEDDITALVVEIR
jgi:sigma-B regulation protein RsbU (phosphoserine phosphatase)